MVDIITQRGYKYVRQQSTKKDEKMKRHDMFTRILKQIEIGRKRQKKRSEKVDDGERKRLESKWNKREKRIQALLYRANKNFSELLEGQSFRRAVRELMKYGADGRITRVEPAPSRKTRKKSDKKIDAIRTGKGDSFAKKDSGALWNYFACQA